MGTGRAVAGVATGAAAWGAFTGASEKHIGKFQEADGGTLFLDEIGELRLDMQVKLLRAIQEGEVDPVGAKRPVKVNIRLISATNRNLTQLAQEGRFREDLYYRLNVFPVQVPPLRDRIDDLPDLVESLAAQQPIDGLVRAHADTGLSPVHASEGVRAGRSGVAVRNPVAADAIRPSGLALGISGVGPCGGRRCPMALGTARPAATLTKTYAVAAPRRRSPRRMQWPPLGDAHQDVCSGRPSAKPAIDCTPTTACSANAGTVATPAYVKLERTPAVMESIRSSTDGRAGSMYMRA